MRRKIIFHIRYPFYLFAQHTYCTAFGNVLKIFCIFTNDINHISFSCPDQVIFAFSPFIGGAAGATHDHDHDDPDDDQDNPDDHVDDYDEGDGDGRHDGI